MVLISTVSTFFILLTRQSRAQRPCLLVLPPPLTLRTAATTQRVTQWNERSTFPRTRPDSNGLLCLAGVENAMILSPRLAAPSPLSARHPQTQRALVRGHEQSVDPHSSRIERPAARGGAGEEEQRKLEGSEGRSAHRGAACRRPARPRCRPQSRTALPPRSAAPAAAAAPCAPPYGACSAVAPHRRAGGGRATSRCGAAPARALPCLCGRSRRARRVDGA